MARCAQVTLSVDNLRRILKAEPLTIRVPAGADSVRLVIDHRAQVSAEFIDVLRKFEELTKKRG